MQSVRVRAALCQGRSSLFRYYTKPAIEKNTATANDNNEKESPKLRPLQQYDEYVKEGKIKRDVYQRRVLWSLDAVYESLVSYERKPIAHSWWTRFLGGQSGSPGPDGIYMWGDVGCGKTMLMDLFYTTVPSHLTKHRIHFHAFMQDIHKRIHALKADETVEEDPLEIVTHEVAKMCDVLCLDEMQVTDIADAMIIRHLFEGLYHDGVVTFFTSNREPSELYKNGIQRESFIPTIHLIERRNHIVYLQSPVDYRKLPRPASGVYYFGDTTTSEAREHAKKWFDYFADMTATTTNRQLHIWGRPIVVPLSAGRNVMQFTFAELCEEYRSAADYLELCRNFDAAVITDIPTLSLDKADLVRRFITFIDAAYDSHLKLAVTAVKPFDQLFSTNDITIDPTSHELNARGENKKSILDPANFGGRDEMFAFARALSRLKQMSSEDWLESKR